MSGMDVTFQLPVLSYIACSLIKLVYILGLSVVWHLYFITWYHIYFCEATL